MSLAEFAERMKIYLDMKLEIVLQENRTVMLRLLEKKRSFVKLSLHKMFLQAPASVLSALSHFIRGSKKESALIRKFIQENLVHAEKPLRMPKLVTQGANYELQEIYHRLNEKYFEGKLNLQITWYGAKPRKKRRSRVTFGLYCPALRLIKIHRMLDKPFFPDFFVAFVVYHEMLHSVVPIVCDKKGRTIFHGKEFKEKERLFEEFERARCWEKQNKEQIFGLNYGRT